MSMTKYVSFVTNRQFEKAVRHVLSASDSAKELKNSAVKAVKAKDIYACGLFDNAIDPFKMKVTISISRKHRQQWLKNEIKRQIDKTFEQKIGEFHQILLGSVNGWVDLGVGDDTEVDLFNKDEEIYIELKNKFNTCNGDSLNKVRDKLEAIVRSSRTASAYWAYIIPNTKNKSDTKVWKKKGRRLNKRINKCWGSDVYKLVTGKAESLDETYKALPKAINIITGSSKLKTFDDIGEEIYTILLPHMSLIIDQAYSKTLKNR